MGVVYGLNRIDMSAVGEVKILGWEGGRGLSVSASMRKIDLSVTLVHQRVVGNALARAWTGRKAREGGARLVCGGCLVA